ncbi:acyl-CoA dehydrogenase family protein [Conexibacter sp. JD483]|uniref:acyl-CoA dehydrogenase family protein n=1 Tax=unclassified Conexibacter TaxID=2627773 RepID=UPI0027287206|nr:MULTISPECIES: acyl-CoA dehydrogenase family protein [unclassified Conexibacter]MDO8187795.1 acyl-CoA dehydrogenase family protein [Conexibacter sp. CPCC 205706]MDO8199996.1 acyl-CoA dehydrogenase family protein [Conexibacter sp. CPCC 205762]MDR9369523.1 acyl-CoA dehydrogenase family protein [Conexibacter sp. JD483]
MATTSPSLALVESDEHRLLREAVAAIAGDFGHAYFRRVTDAVEPPRELWKALAAHGYLGVNIPAEYDGGGLGLVELAIVGEELAAAGCPLLPLLVSPGIAGTLLARHGSPAQKQRWLRGLGDGSAHYAFAITEPDAGSNSHRIATRARRADDGRGWLLRGTKTYISGVEDCQALLVMARTGDGDEQGRGGLSLFIVDVDAPGLERQVIETVMRAPERQWTLFFDDVEVGEERLLGGVGEGLRVGFDGLNPERVLAAATCNGIGRYALAKASAYACERAVWGQPIGAHQGVAHPLAEAKIALEAARLMTAQAAALHDAAAPAGEAANMAKLLAADAGALALDRAIQAHGGNGLSVEYGLADLWWIVRLLRIAPVSREMVLNYVAQHSLGLPRSY